MGQEDLIAVTSHSMLCVITDKLKFTVEDCVSIQSETEILDFIDIFLFRLKSFQNLSKSVEVTSSQATQHLSSIF